MWTNTSQTTSVSLTCRLSRTLGRPGNALTVGASSELGELPTDPAYAGWDVVAEAGELSPYSRTSILFGTRPWPISRTL
jgi:hypothetical protein